MRWVPVLMIGAVVATAVAVPAIATGGSPASPAAGTPQPPLCQADAVKQFKLSVSQASAVTAACDTFKATVAAADRAFALEVDKLAANDRAGLWQARQERRTAVWAARDEFQATAHDTLGIARPNAGGPGRGIGSGRASADGRRSPRPGRWGAPDGQGQRRGMGRQARCPYAPS